MLSKQAEAVSSSALRRELFSLHLFLNLCAQVQAERNPTPYTTHFDWRNSQMTIQEVIHSLIFNIRLY